MRNPNALRWGGSPGHYEVHYLTLTDARTKVGVWVRYSMLAPLNATGEAPQCALWFLAMDPRGGQPPTVGRKASFGIEQLHARAKPFDLRIGDATLTDEGMDGAFEDVAWNLRWRSSTRAFEHVHPLVRRLGAAKTILVLPHPDLSIDGTISFAGQRFELAGTRGGQAHLWGSKHARAWAWTHCNDFCTNEGEPVPGCFVDGVSVLLLGLGRELGPSTPVVACVDGEEFCSTSPCRILANWSAFALTGWRFEAIDGARKFVAPGRAHFEYAQRTPVPGLELHTT